MDGRALPDRDTKALVGVLAVLEAMIQAGQLDGEAVGRLRRRLRNDDYLALDSETGVNDHDVRQKIDDLNQRLRYVLGEHDDPGASFPVWSPSS